MQFSMRVFDVAPQLTPIFGSALLESRVDVIDFVRNREIIATLFRGRFVIAKQPPHMSAHSIEMVDLAFQ